MADFGSALPKTAAHEAGYANVEGDAGGETYAGITRKEWPLCLVWKAVDSCKAALGLGSGKALSKSQLATLNKCITGNSLTAPAVAGFYKPRYWDALNLDSEPDQLIAEKAFDIAVNMGVTEARTFLTNAHAEVGDA